MGVLTGDRKRESEKDVFSPASSFIETVEYSEKDRTLDLTFRSGSKIRYIQVYPSTFQSFKQSPTHSAYYARAIKGNLMSVKIIDAGIGTQKSAPLKKLQKEHDLDGGLRGTVNRALNA